LENKFPHNIQVFDDYAKEYDQWFEDHSAVFESEARAIEQLLPLTGNGIEIGVGTGRFAARLGIKIGVEPSEQMAKLAKERGIKIIAAKAEQLPFKNNEYDFALLVTVLCFLENPVIALTEAARIVKPSGKIVVAIINRDSPLGLSIEASKASNHFYKSAKLYIPDEIELTMQKAGLKNFTRLQTLFGPLDQIKKPQRPREGSSEGGFVILSGAKT